MAATFLPDANGNTNRPPLLSVLGILTFSNTALCILLYGIAALGMFQVQHMNFEDFHAVFEDGALDFLSGDERDQLEALIPVLHEKGVVLMLIFLSRTVLRLIGAIGIWRGKKSGFYLYATAQLLGIFAPHLILPWEFLGIGGPIMAVVFTAAYGSQAKRLS